MLKINVFQMDSRTFCHNNRIATLFLPSIISLNCIRESSYTELEIDRTIITCIKFKKQ